MRCYRPPGFIFKTLPGELQRPDFAYEIAKYDFSRLAVASRESLFQHLRRFDDAVIRLDWVGARPRWAQPLDTFAGAGGR